MKTHHPSADISKSATIGKGSYVWQQAQVRENVKIGNNCIIGKGAYIDFSTIIGNNVKIQNYASIYHYSILEDGVFIGPYVCITNDKLPRAITPEGNLKTVANWKSEKTVVKKGASLGACSVILPGLEIGEYSLIGAQSLVTKNVPAHALMIGSPAKLAGYVCICGVIISRGRKKPKVLRCINCQKI